LPQLDRNKISIFWKDITEQNIDWTTIEPKNTSPCGHVFESHGYKVASLQWCALQIPWVRVVICCNHYKS
jgi:hypothetical protein